jgi:S1-C subfamily serine protease
MKRIVLLLAAAWLSLDSSFARDDVDVTKPVQVIEARVPIQVTGPGAQKSFKFAVWKSLLDPTEIAGGVASGLFCSNTRPLYYVKGFDTMMLNSVSHAFHEEAAKAGYAANERDKSVFEQKVGSGTDFRVGATLLEVDFRYCGSTEGKGSAYGKIKWEVFSERLQRVIYTADIAASMSARDSAIAQLEFRQRFARALVDNLLGDPNFAEAVRTEGEGSASPAAAPAPLALSRGQAVAGDVSHNAPALQAAVVTIESGTVSGTGFFISQEGYLLTNQHVVSDAKFVRVRLSDGRTMVGEVLRGDRPRDVALVKTDPIATAVLAARAGEARVGEDVYVLGSPLGNTLSGTLTKGVLSAHRVLDGVSFLQSDAAVNPGNSGGPLMDVDGRVIGITDIGSNAHGLGLFIPIDEAIEKLGLTISGRDSSR